MTQYGVGSSGSVTSIRTTGPDPGPVHEERRRVQLRAERDLLVLLLDHVHPSDVAQCQPGRPDLQLVVDHPDPHPAQADQHQHGQRAP